MKKKDKSGTLWWILLIIVLICAGIGYYYFSRMGSEKAKTPIISSRPDETEKDQLQKKREEPGKPVVPIERRDIPPAPAEEEPSGKLPSRLEDPCTRIDKEVEDFFLYLDQKKYIKELELGMDSFAVFKKIVLRLASFPPVPAGEGIDSDIILKNMFHFFRVLDIKHIYFLKEIFERERDTLEIHFRTLYSWLTSGDRCPDPESLKPGMDVLYKYAGFFLNTTGGRAYLSRRPSETRLLVNYYSLLIVHQADSLEKNNYGINIQPLIKPIRNEMKRYPELRFQKDYLAALSQMETYYLKKRK